MTRANGAVHDSRRSMQHAEGPAAVLAIGTANPTGTIVPQDEFAYHFFRVTKSDHLTDLKEKLTRICQKTGIEKRHFHMTEEMLLAHPEFIDRELPSLDARIDIVATAVPKLAETAAVKAITEWGRPATDITHLIFSTYSGCRAPSADLELSSLLGLRPTVCRTILNLHGCYGGGRALHLAKELAENNRGARVLVACSEITLVCFGGPDGSNLVGHALFGDGAGAVIVGAGPFTGDERPLFEMVAATQTTIPGTEYALGMQVAGGGIDFHLAIQVPMLLGQNVEQTLLDAIRSALGDDVDVPSWNDLFWAVHPGGRPILDNIDKVLKLEPGKLAASRHVLREYGNMSGATIVFVLDELRRRREEEGDQQPEWGAMLAFGPGITIETMVLRSACGRGLKET
ncbi:bisdemethoxycurcumin synthase-like [Phragmites australis]|uniref:bisdemethoxycurcumin synthase-like n=1 Tax=Phragmites australis TaxID=29695 RepID=UPI002D7A27B3|nr:bisdemethoxycurcumin synthase-like [Phragmites australis]XP_062225320.1 bisdemethoxycurcumin synthase-like [Phragmites australis]